MQFNMQLWRFSSLVLKCAPFVFPPSVYGEATIKRVRGNALHARKPNAPKASVFPKNMSRWKENYSFLSLITLFFVSLKATSFLFFLPAAIADSQEKLSLFLLGWMFLYAP